MQTKILMTLIQLQSLSDGSRYIRKFQALLLFTKMVNQLSFLRTILFRLCRYIKTGRANARPVTQSDFTLRRELQY